MSYKIQKIYEFLQFDYSDIMNYKITKKTRLHLKDKQPKLYYSPHKQFPIQQSSLGKHHLQLSDQLKSAHSPNFKLNKGYFQQGKVKLGWLFLKKDLKIKILHQRIVDQISKLPLQFTKTLAILDKDFIHHILFLVKNILKLTDDADLIHQQICNASLQKLIMNHQQSSYLRKAVLGCLLQGNPQFSPCVINLFNKFKNPVLNSLAINKEAAKSLALSVQQFQLKQHFPRLYFRQIIQFIIKKPKSQEIISLIEKFEGTFLCEHFLRLKILIFNWVDTSHLSTRDTFKLVQNLLNLRLMFMGQPSLPTKILNYCHSFQLFFQKFSSEKSLASYFGNQYKMLFSVLACQIFDESPFYDEEIVTFFNQLIKEDKNCIKQFLMSSVCLVKDMGFSINQIQQLVMRFKLLQKQWTQSQSYEIKYLAESFAALKLKNKNIKCPVTGVCMMVCGDRVFGKRQIEQIHREKGVSKQQSKRVGMEWMKLHRELYKERKDQLNMIGSFFFKFNKRLAC